MIKKNSSPAKKSTKKEDKDFQHVLKSLETEHKALTPPEATGVIQCLLRCHESNISLTVRIIDVNL